jgi:hypothetical protein
MFSITDKRCFVRHSFTFRVWDSPISISKVVIKNGHSAFYNVFFLKPKTLELIPRFLFMIIEEDFIHLLYKKKDFV